MLASAGSRWQRLPDYLYELLALRPQVFSLLVTEK